MNKKFVSLTLLSAIVALTFFVLPVKPQNITTLYVEPQLTTIKPLRTFEINISIANVTDLEGWEFKLYYPNSLLNATEIKEGPFLKTAGGTFFMVKEFTDNYNETHGRIWAACVLEGQGPGTSGAGTLEMITFKAKLNGTAILHLAETDLIDSEMPPNHISHVTADGDVKILSVDISILNAETSKTIAGQGFPVDVSVTVKNQGETIETFNLTLYANTTAINQTQITLTSGTSTTITLTWNTTTFEKGNYTISVYVWPVPGEIDKTDNTYTDGVVYLGIPGDVNGDGWVDVMDLLEMAFAYGSYPGHPSYDPNLDIDGNEFIDVMDLLIAAMNYGQHDP